LTAPELVLAEAAPACCEDEKWKPVQGWPHESSTCGRFRTVTRVDATGRLRFGQMLALCPDRRKGKGYLYVNLRDGKRHRRAAVAPLVLETHDRPRPGPGYEACHNRGIRDDNHLTELRWDTREANLADMAEHQRLRALEASLETVTRYGPQVSRGAFWFRPWRYGVTGGRPGDAAKGTGRSPSFLPFPSVSPSVQPSPGPVRSLLRRRP
jgi:hypothetical protein